MAARRPADDFLLTLEPGIAQLELRAALLAARLRVPSPLPQSGDPALIKTATDELLRDPHNLELARRTAAVLAIKSDYNRAVDILDTCARHAPSAVVRAQITLIRAHSVEFHQEKFGVVIAFLYEALDTSGLLTPFRARAHLLLGLSQLRLGSFHEAEGSFRRVLEFKSSGYVPLGHLYLSTLANRQKQFGVATAEIARAAKSLGGRQPVTARRIEMNQIGTRLGIAKAARADVLDADRVRELITDIEAARDRAYDTRDVSTVAVFQNNLGVAHKLLADVGRDAAAHYITAARAYARAARLHESNKKLASASQSFRNLGLALDDAGEHAAGLAAVAHSERVTALAPSPDAVFRNTLAATQIAQSDKQNATAEGLLRALSEMIADNRSAVSKISRVGLEEFGRVAGAAFIDGLTGAESPLSIADAATEKGAARLHELVGSLDAVDIDAQLGDVLSSELDSREAPPAGKILSFLSLVSGYEFQASDYSSEFDLSRDRTYQQLKELCERRVLKLVGNRKAARYRVHVPLLQDRAQRA